MDAKERLAEIEKILEDAIDLSKERCAPIIVEGEKDERALRLLGFKGIILRLGRGRSVLDFCEETAREYKSVIILTDWDRQGGRLCASMRKYFAALCVKYDDEIRKKLLFYCKKDIKDVESLSSLVENLRREAGSLDNVR